MKITGGWQKTNHELRQFISVRQKNVIILGSVYLRNFVSIIKSVLLALMMKYFLPYKIWILSNVLAKRSCVAIKCNQNVTRQMMKPF